LVQVQPSQPGSVAQFALEAHKDEHPAFNRRAIGSIPIGRTKAFREDVGKRLSRQTFNLEIAGSNPAVLTRVPFVQRIRTRVYETRNSGSNPERDTKCGRVFQRPGWGTVSASTGVRFPSRPPKIGCWLGAATTLGSSTAATALGSDPSVRRFESFLPSQTFLWSFLRALNAEAVEAADCKPALIRFESGSVLHAGVV
jgi:hypothetical protein